MSFLCFYRHFQFSYDDYYIWYSTNMYAGRLWSKLYDERPICPNGTGCCGCVLCLVTIPLGVYHPISGMTAFCCISNHLRRKAIEKYHVKPDEECTCCCGRGCCSSWVNYCHFGCNYPCSLFQVMVSVDKWDNEIKGQASIRR